MSLGLDFLPEVARLISLDIGKEFLPGDVYGLMIFGLEYEGLKKFNTEEVSDILATYIKETSRLCPPSH
jgi:hypothetical protein